MIRARIICVAGGLALLTATAGCGRTQLHSLEQRGGQLRGQLDAAESSAAAAASSAAQGTAAAALPAGALGALEIGPPVLSRQACAAAGASALGSIAHRVYGEAVSSEQVRVAVRFAQNSRRLARAVMHHDPGLARGAARALIATGHVARIEVDDGRRVLADVGTPRAIAPTSGVITDSHGRSVGHFRVAIQTVDGLALTIQGLTGGRVIVHGSRRGRFGNTHGLPANLPAHGELRALGRPIEVVSMNVTPFDGRTLWLSVLRSRRALTRYCRRDVDETVAAVLGAVGARMYAYEASSHKVSAALERVRSDGPLVRAVLAGDARAVRHAIDALLNRHIVRIRISGPRGMLVDVGGPHVLAPAATTMTVAGLPIGRVVLSLQDDLGYVLLAQRLLGVEVVLRQGGTQVMSTAGTPPPSIPRFGRLHSGGRNYVASSFMGQAFPTGRLRISLLVPDGLVPP
jgi:hypothetical protein